MCRPDSYLTGIRVHSGQYLDRVVKIECTRWGRSASRAQVPRRAIGTLISTESVVRCTSADGSSTLMPDRAIHGIEIRADWLTDGIQIRCRR
ncbi:MAG: hypothetical protein JW751_07055 [Polyangiaceae bacterium]|nr:hypothetical protein [Polyangiaceae bacterium]